MRFFVVTLALTCLLTQPAYPCADATADAGGGSPDEHWKYGTALEQLGRKGLELPATRRLRFRSPRPDDIVKLLPMYQDFETVQYTWFRFELGEVRWTEQTLRERFEWQAGEQLQGNRYDFVVELVDQPGTVIGRFAIYDAAANGDRELGLTLAKPYWGQGYGEEVCRAAFAFAFRDLYALDVVLEVLPENQGMQRLARRMGLTLVQSAIDAAPSGPFQLRYDYYRADRPTSPFTH